MIASAKSLEGGFKIRIIGGSGSAGSDARDNRYRSRRTSLLVNRRKRIRNINVRFTVEEG
jgi:hypothetical protein